jgi:hypothetical protein
MDHIESVVRKYDASGKVVYRSIERIGQSLNAAGSGDNYGQHLAQYHATMKQIDTLWDNMDPLLSLTIPTPRKPSADVYSTPQLLSSLISADDSEALVVPAKRFKASVPHRTALAEHNALVDSILDDFDERVDAWRDDLRRKN